MPIQRTRFRPPAPARRKRTGEINVRPLGGVHKGLPPQDLPIGMSPECQNFVPKVDGYITPRSGLSQNGTWDFAGPVLGAMEMFDIQGRSNLLAPSDKFINFRHADDTSWASFSYTAGSQTWFNGDLSGSTKNYFRGTSVYDQNTNAFIGIVCNGFNSLKFFRVQDSETSFSDFTWTDSINSTVRAQDIASVNDRLVLFNCVGLDSSSNEVAYPTRVMWSARGNPKSFLIADGAGAEDLMDMQGEGKAAVRFRDFLLLFTDYEVWRATPTLDNYAFRFDRVRDATGCAYPNTIAQTPIGVAFLGRDREVYITDGSSTIPLGPISGDGPSRIQRLMWDDATDLDRAWATFNESEQRYELYFTHRADSTDGYPGRALYYALDDRTWWPQKFAFGLSGGVDVTDPWDFVTWDEATQTYADLISAWNALDSEQKERRVAVFDSKGTQLSFRSTQTSDDGTAIDARWRSGGLRVGDFRKTHLTEVWTDYEADSASSFSLYIGSSRNTQDFDSGTKLAMTNPGGLVHAPTWKTDTAPLFEIRLNDGGTPRIVSFMATVKEASRF